MPRLSRTLYSSHEAVARTIAAAPVPVFTGIGHDIDRSVADEVAHTALKTPTACAGALIERVGGYLSAADEVWRRVEQRAAAVLDGSAAELTELAHGIAGRTRAAVGRADERLQWRRHQVATLAPAALVRAGERIDRTSERTVQRSARTVERESDRLDVVAARIAAVDPAVQLARVWTITRRADGAVVRSVADVAQGERLATTTLDGDIHSVIDAVHPTASPEDPT